LFCLAQVFYNQACDCANSYIDFILWSNNEYTGVVTGSVLWPRKFGLSGHMTKVNEHSVENPPENAVKVPRVEERATLHTRNHSIELNSKCVPYSGYIKFHKYGKVYRDFEM